MTHKTLGVALSVLGVVLLTISLAADLLGLGARAGIGWKQLTGAAVGILLFLVGIWSSRRKIRLPN